jgi:hypothetical protein
MDLTDKHFSRIIGDRIQLVLDWNSDIPKRFYFCTRRRSVDPSPRIIRKLCLTAYERRSTKSLLRDVQNFVPVVCFYTLRICMYYHKRFIHCVYHDVFMNRNFVLLTTYNKESIDCIYILCKFICNLWYLYIYIVQHFSFFLRKLRIVIESHHRVASLIRTIS